MAIAKAGRGSMGVILSTGHHELDHKPVLCQPIAARRRLRNSSPDKTRDRRHLGREAKIRGTHQALKHRLPLLCVRRSSDKNAGAGPDHANAMERAPVRRPSSAPSVLASRSAAASLCNPPWTLRLIRRRTTDNREAYTTLWARQRNPGPWRLRGRLYIIIC